MIKFRQLEDLARELIGDGKRPNLFFVTVEGNVYLVTWDARIAYKAWQDIDNGSRETALEDRLHGVLASTEFDPDARRWVTYDEAEQMLRGRR